MNNIINGNTNRNSNQYKRPKVIPAPAKIVLRVPLLISPLNSPEIPEPVSIPSKLEMPLVIGANKPQINLPAVLCRPRSSFLIYQIIFLSFHLFY